jgi:hypothetical protein
MPLLLDDAGGGKTIVVLIMEALLTALGAGTNDVLAAFLGSICGAFLLTRATPRLIVSTVVVGTLVGTYFGPNTMAMIGRQPSNAWTFVIGSIGMAVLTAAGSYVRQKFLSGGKNDPVDAA